MVTSNPRPEIIMKLRDAVVPSYALLAALELDIFSALDDGPKSPEILAQIIEGDTEKLGVLLYSLVSIGLLDVGQNGFSNSAEAAHFLVKGNPDYLGTMYQAQPDRWNAILKTAESIRTGKAKAKADYSLMSPEELEAHYRGFYFATMARGRELLNRYDFSASKKMLDLGGGTGGVAITLVQALPKLQATILDLPSVTPVSQRYVDQAGVADRVKVIGANFLEDRLDGTYDVVVMGAIFPVLSPDQIAKALQNVSQAVEVGGRLFVTDNGFLAESRTSPHGAVANNLWFINEFDHGGAKTLTERREWMEMAGFIISEQFVRPDGFGMMVGVKP